MDWNILIARLFLVSVKLTGVHMLASMSLIRLKCVALTMTPDTFPRCTRIKCVYITIVPLAVQVIGHVDDIVNDSGDSIDWECLEVPIRCRSCDRDRLVCAKLLLEDCEKLEIVDAIGFLADRLAPYQDVRGLL